MCREEHKTNISCHSDGNDSPHRHGVLSLLRAIGCDQLTRKPDASIAQRMSGLLPLGDAGPHPVHGSLGPRKSVTQTASRSIHLLAVVAMRRKSTKISRSLREQHRPRQQQPAQSSPRCSCDSLATCGDVKICFD